MDKKVRPMQRRLSFSFLVLLSQLLLIALAISWLVHMFIIATSGSVFFVENNPYICWVEITVSVLITIFAIYILVVQVHRLGERREADRNRRST
jgi:uncharacterized BrkB/YihY/UPF0761 family membrane protein